MTTSSSNNLLDRILDQFAECLTPETARRIVALCADSATQTRLDELADKNTEGELSEDELAEYDASISALNFVTILQAKVRTLLEQDSHS